MRVPFRDIINSLECCGWKFTREVSGSTDGVVTGAIAATTAALADFAGARAVAAPAAALALPAVCAASDPDERVGGGKVPSPALANATVGTVESAGAAAIAAAFAPRIAGDAGTVNFIPTCNGAGLVVAIRLRRAN